MIRAAGFTIEFAPSSWRFSHRQARLVPGLAAIVLASRACLREAKARG